MKQVLFASALAAMAVTAASPSSAQTMYDCQSIAKPTARLACYDKLSPPIAKGAKPRKSETTSSTLDKEDARMKQLLRPICRNC